MAGPTSPYEIYWGNEAVISVTDKQTSPIETAIAVIKGWEIRVTAEHKELYGQDSILRQDVRRYNLKVPVKIKYCKFVADVDQDFLLQVLKGDSSAVPTGAIADTSEVALFTIKGQVTNGSTALLATVSDVYFEEVPFVGPENDYIVRDLSGIGKSVAFTNPT